MPSKFPGVFSILWLVWCALWALRSLVVRRGRTYAKGRRLQDKNRSYKFVSSVVYVGQVLIGGASFLWPALAESPHAFNRATKFLLLVPEADWLRALGLGICYLGLLLSVLQLVYLGSNYSPCFDSHLPNLIVQDGPYRFVRHPGWLAKIFSAMGGVIATGSLWFLPVFVWLFVELRRTIRVEESYLQSAFPEYDDYRRRTKKLIPFLY